MPSRSRQQTKPRRKLSIRRRIVFSLIAVCVVFALAEGALRLFGIGSRPPAAALQFGYDTGIPKIDTDGIEQEGHIYDKPLFEEDVRLFWKPLPDTPYTDRHGWRSPGPSHRNKLEDAYRIAVIGDSCSFLGKDLYPNLFAKKIAESLHQPVDVVNASCPGYSSFQGARRLEDVWPWQPDLLVIYFGWNDHWNSLNQGTDRQTAQQRSNMAAMSQGVLRHLHVFEALRQMVEAMRTPQQGEDNSLGERNVRVPRDAYLANLKSMIRAASQHNCRVLLITAPTLFVEGRMPYWAYPFFGQNYRMSRPQVDAIPELHKSYSNIIRKLSQSEQGAMLADLETHWKPEASLSRFRRDCIHLSEKGHRDAADFLFQVWQRNRQMNKTSRAD